MGSDWDFGDGQAGPCMDRCMLVHGWCTTISITAFLHRYWADEAFPLRKKKGKAGMRTIDPWHGFVVMVAR